MENIQLALQLMAYGVPGVFAVLLIFFALTKLLPVIFPNKENSEIKTNDLTSENTEIQTKEINMDKIMKTKFLQIFRICALLLCIMFFTVPLIKCSHDSSINATAMEIAAGTGDLFEETEESGNPIVFALIVIPAVIFIISLASKSYSLLRNISAAGLTAKIAFIIGLYTQVSSDKYSEAFEMTEYNWIIAAMYTGLIFIAQIGIKSETNAAGDSPPHQQSAVCPKCGTKNESGAKFCASCGTVINE
jgi:Na+-transporting methylmalonyl-CoA/oxaloacetate decarboxylase gamma subunit